MIRSHDLCVCETVEEAKAAIKSMRRPKVVRKPRSKTGYLNLTSTLDIETTNTEEDGFIYTIQFNINGQNVLFRYVEDFLNFFDWLIEYWRINVNRRFVLYVHNLGYEFYYLGQVFTRYWHTLNQLFTSSKKPLYLRYENGIELRDSFKLFQKSLAAATKGLPHEKLSGDLDYSVYRTPDTKLTQKELDYCVNDVQGLWEAVERLKTEHEYNQASIPLTNTAMVIQEVNRHISGDHKTFKAMQDLVLTKRQLDLCYKAMAGGDTHGCRWKAGRTFYQCNSLDEKSAHPSQQLLRPFPYGNPIDMESADEDDIEDLIDTGYGWVAHVYIAGVMIRNECPDPTISVSKCDEILDKGGVDNGRLLSAEAISVHMDSNDWMRFKEAYTYDYVEVPYLIAFRLKELPEAFTGAIFEKFRIKETQKDSPNYMFSKICVNTIFGACAQKTVRDEYAVTAEDLIECDTTKWEVKLAGMKEEDVAKSQKMKYPFLWGLWTSSLSRLTLWNLLKAVGWERAIYWDTDSCKYEGGKDLPGVIEYNQNVVSLCEKNHRTIRTDNGPVYIGIAEDEYPGVEYGYKSFRFLHAKCYAAEAWNKKTGDYEIVTTIAGVGKKEGAAAMNGTVETLKDGLYIENAGGNKLRYTDRPIYTRHDFSRPTMCASYIYMSPRDYEVKTHGYEKLEYEIIGD